MLGYFFWNIDLLFQISSVISWGDMQAKLPALAVTDPNTDIGKGIVEGGFGLAV